MLILILIGFILLRLVPYLFWLVPTGYDAGIYLFLFKIFPQIPQWQKVGFSPGLFYLTWPLTKLGLPAEAILVPLQIAAEVFLFGCMYWVVKKLIDRKTAILAVFLLTISAVQFRAFWYFYVKNVFALGLMILALYFLSQKKLIKSLVFSFLTAIFHLPTFLMLFLIMLLSNLKIAGLAILLGGLAYLANFQLAIKPFLLPLLRVNSGSSGSFYSLTISWLLTLLYLPLAIYGLKKKSNLKPFLIGLIVCLVWVVMRLFFFNRFFITLNIFLIFWAAIGLKQLMDKYRQHWDLFQFYFVVCIIFIVAFIWKTGQPLINIQLLNEIKSFKAEENASLLSTGKADTAWLLGWTEYPVIAWGYGGE
ncbi:hypothetical protein L6272_02005, partial [Microgenomates group bacterium]|nr:hypothetical protein [Microgenomates group bacterium]